ncbi:MAG TPA: FIST N-terminal domain-containing protein [Pirellulales bacterium]|nr:FIST N-terminal domain-containing protein [Pirellulales bacterium]
MTNTACQFASALFDSPDPAVAVEAACQQVSEALAGAPDLAVCFVSHDHAPALEQIVAELDRRLRPRVLLGCTGESIAGVGREIEQSPAISLWAARLPGVTVLPMHLDFQRTPEGGSFTGWPDELPAQWPAGAALIMLAEPFSFPADTLLERLGEDQPHVPIVGGMASGAFSPGENRVFLNHAVYDSGAVAVLLHGALQVDTVVSQGCRPIGRPLVVTKADRNVIYELGGRPAMAQLQEIFNALPPHDQQLVQQGLHVGRVIDEYRQTFGRGDFLIRNVVGADRATGAIAIGDFVRVGQTVQFHVRDSASADEDLRALLDSVRSTEQAGAAGALLFTCNGRGTRLFDVPDHDAAAVQALLGDIPLAGFFAQGEIGPVGGKNFLHGFTASVAVFRGKVTAS